MLILRTGELQIRPNGGVDGQRIANSPERVVAGLFRISALEMLILWPVELQIRPNGAYKIKGDPTFIVNQAVMRSAT